MTTAYAELSAASNFSFLEAASHPEELVVRAAGLGAAAIAITDSMSVSGLVRAHVAAKQAGIRLVVGCRLELADGPDLLVYPEDRGAYGRLMRLLSQGKRRAPKGECQIALSDVLDDTGVFAAGAGQVIAVVPPKRPDASFRDALRELSANLRSPPYLFVFYDVAGGRGQLGRRAIVQTGGVAEYAGTQAA